MLFFHFLKDNNTSTSWKTAYSVEMHAIMLIYANIMAQIIDNLVKVKINNICILKNNILSTPSIILSLKEKIMTSNLSLVDKYQVKLQKM